MHRKIKMLGIIAVLVCAIAVCQRAGAYLYRNYITEEKEEVSSLTEQERQGEKWQMGENQGEKVQSGEKNQSGGEKEKEQLVVIDAGHGGMDPGKVGVNGALEKELNLIIARKVQVLLEEQGITVAMTREDENGLADTKVEDLKARVALINKKKPVLAVSIHQNSYQDGSIHGAQVFYFTHSEEGEAVAKAMQEALLGVDSENKRQAKANDTYYMLKKTEVPVIIVECGFLSNQEEADKLVTDEYQTKLAEVISEGIIKCIEK